jgi:D-alanyl-D-alanine dipeptidase
MIQSYIIGATLLLVSWSCVRSEESDCMEDIDAQLTEENLPETLPITNVLRDTLGPKFEAAGLIDVQTVHAGIMVDLKYASEDNFMRTNVYGGLTRAFLQPEVAQRLAKVQHYLDEQHPDLCLLVYDATRPRSVQKIMWELLDSIPTYERSKFVSNPANGSIHNYGCAVDLTLFDKAKGQVLDMGADYDDIRKIAYPELEAQFLKSGELTKEQHQNRLLLRNAMKQGGFWVLPTEWWHFNAYHRNNAKAKYAIIE